jgi:hypothetical protein
MRIFRRLAAFLSLGIESNAGTLIGIRRVLGYQQLTTLQLAASIGFTMPVITTPGIQPGQTGIAQQTTNVPVSYARIQVDGGSVRWRDDGVAPTTAIGMLMIDGASLDYYGDVSALRFIVVGVTTPTVNASLYG